MCQCHVGVRYQHVSNTCRASVLHKKQPSNEKSKSSKVQPDVVSCDDKKSLRNKGNVHSGFL